MTYDVAVVGAGPAGCSAAMTLCKRGYIVALLDRASFPRDKTCGEFLNPGACRLLSEVFGLGFPELIDAGGMPVSKITLELQRRPLEIPILDKYGALSPGVSLQRMVFDHLLISKCEAAGVHVLQKHNVQLVERGFDSIYLTGKHCGEPFTIGAKLVLAADGTHSLVARREGLVRPIARLNAIGVVFHFENVAQSESNNGVWMFPAIGDRMLFGSSRQAGRSAILSGAIPTSFARSIASDAKGFAHRFIAQHPKLQTVVHDSTITRVTTAPCFGHTLTRCFADRMLFLGDAACFIDPFSGEGIHHALESGVLADGTVELAFARGDLSERTLAHYHHRRRDLRARYKLCDVTQMVCSKPWLIDLVGEQLRRRPAAARQLIAALTDIIDAQSVLSARFALRLLLPAIEKLPIKRRQMFVRNAE